MKQPSPLESCLAPVITILLFVAPVPSFAGAISGGGGAAVVCRNADHSIASAELLDLYEGKVRFGYEIPESPGLSADTQIATALDRLGDDRYVALKAKEFARDIIERIRYLPEGVSLNAPLDLGESYGAVVKEGCRMEGVGFYEADGTLKIARPVFSALSTTQKAALILHEAIYKIDRTVENAANSARSRKLTAQFFSTSLENNEILNELNELLTGRISNPTSTATFIAARLPRSGVFTVEMEIPEGTSVGMDGPWGTRCWSNLEDDSRTIFSSGTPVGNTTLSATVRNFKCDQFGSFFRLQSGDLNLIRMKVYSGMELLFDSIDSRTDWYRGPIYQPMPPRPGYDGGAGFHVAFPSALPPLPAIR